MATHRNFLGIEFGLLFVALVCAGFAPWRGEQPSPERQLSSAQKARLVRTLQPVAPALPDLAVWSDDVPENVRYRLELTRVFRAAGVRTDAAELTRSVSTQQQGLVIGVRDQERPPPKAIAFVRALRKGGLDPSFAKDAGLEERPQDFTIGVVSPSRLRSFNSAEALPQP